MKEKKKGSRLVRQLFFALLPIQITSSVVLFLNSLIDTIIVGNFVGKDRISIITLTNPLTLVISLIGGVVAIGAQTVAGHRKGEGDEEGVNAVVTNSVLMCFGSGLAATLICLPLARPIALLLGAEDPAVVAALSDYIRGICLGFVFYVFYKSMLAFLQLDNAAGVALVATAAMMISKVVFDLAAVFLLKNGMFGIGLATAGSYFLAAVVGLLYYLFSRTEMKIAPRYISPRVSLEVLHRGLPNAVKDGCSVIRSYAVNRISLAYAGEDVLNIVGIASTVSEVFFSGINGVGSSASILVSVFAGSRDRSSLDDLCEVGLKAGFAINYLLIAVSFALAYPAALLFGADPKMAKEAALAIRLLMCSSLVNAVTTMVNNTYRSMGYIMRVNILTVIQSLCLHIPICALMPRLIGRAGLYSYYFVGDTLFVLGLIVYAAVRHGHAPRRFADLVYIPVNFGARDEDRLDLTVETEDEIVRALRQAERFCGDHGIAAGTGRKCAECLAEAARDALEAPAGKHTRSVDLRLSCEDGALSLTVRSNAALFDPTAGAGSEAHPRMKTVRAAAENLSWHATLGQNVLTARWEA